MGFSDRFGKPSGGVRVKTLRVDANFLFRKKMSSRCCDFLLGHVPFCQALGLNHQRGVARLQGGVCSVDMGGLL